MCSFLVFAEVWFSDALGRVARTVKRLLLVNVEVFAYTIVSRDVKKALNLGLEKVA